MASEQGPRYDLIYQNNDAARNEQLRYTVTSLADKLATTTDRAKAAEADNAQQADRIAALEAEVARYGGSVMMLEEANVDLRAALAAATQRMESDSEVIEAARALIPHIEWMAGPDADGEGFRNVELVDAINALRAALAASSEGRTSGGPRADDGEG